MLLRLPSPFPPPPPSPPPPPTPPHSSSCFIMQTYKPETSCGDPGTPENGLRVGNDWTIGAIVYYQCNATYELVGLESRTCQNDGTWSGSLPACLRLSGWYDRQVKYWYLTIVRMLKPCSIYSCILSMLCNNKCSSDCVLCFHSYIYHILSRWRVAIETMWEL